MEFKPITFGKSNCSIFRAGLKRASFLEVIGKQHVATFESLGTKHEYGTAAESNMRIAIQSKLRGKARRLFVPVSEFSFASFPIEVTRISARCAGRVASPVSLSRRTGATPTMQKAFPYATGN
jgi:hypothetical protein